MRKNLTAGAIVLLLIVGALFCSIAYADQSEELIEAAGKGDLKQVQELLGGGVDVNTRGQRGWTPLTVAAGLGRVDMVKLLLDKGANVDAKNDYGTTALMAAAESGRSEVVKLLLEKGANLDAQDSGGRTVLMYATQNAQEPGAEGNLETVKILLDKGANVNARDKDGKTALMQAVTDRKNLDTVKLLLDRGAEINAQANNGQTALMLEAASVWHEGEHKKPDMMRLLLERGADANAKDQKGWTALMYVVAHPTAQRASVERMILLLDNDADVNAKDKSGKTALMLMLEPTFTGYSSYGPGTRYAKASDPFRVYEKAKFKYGSRALLQHPNDCKDMVKLLLRRGADVNVMDKEGRTALTYVLQPIIEFEAETLTQFKDKDVALSLKVDKGTVKVKQETPTEIVELARAAGAAPSARVSESVPPLDVEIMEASTRGDVGQVKSFLDKGGDVNAKSKEGETALMAAVLAGNPEVVKLLLERGADVNTKSPKGATALLYASTKGNLAIAKLLLDRGANANEPPRDRSWTALMMASSKGYDEIVNSFWIREPTLM